MALREKKSLEDFRNLSDRILTYAQQGTLRTDFLREVSQALRDFSRLDEIVFWLKERGKYYCHRQTCGPEAGFQLEIIPVAKSPQGEINPAYREDKILAELCRELLKGNFRENSPFFTRKGSFWSNDTRLPFAFKKAKSYTLGGEYRSLALIPLLVGREIGGLLQLKSRKPNFFTPRQIEFYEDIAHILGMALVNRRAQVALRERIKELTCLYGIAQVVQKPGITLAEILQGIVELLPPAWLYPEIASARISLDKRVYATPGFKAGLHKQTAEITVNGEKRGKVEINYAQEKPELDEGPFLKEERSLIDNVARQVGLILERKQTEEDRSHLQEQLRHADRLATIGQLSAGVAHELNEPLSSILGFAQLVKKSDPLTGEAQADLEKVIKSALHAREVVKKLMFFARQMPPHHTQVNLNQLVEEGLYFLRSRCARAGIEIVTLLDAKLPALYADPSQLHQVLVNLVVNAVQAMPEGGKLTIRTQAQPEHILLEVKDTGIGMNKEVQKQIFLPFFTTKDLNEGTGLGLPVVHGIVSSHGGNIKVESKVGKGTRFLIKLPFKART